MEHTFMTIHNLTPDANILFASESISDILGYQPEEVQGRSCFDYFHPQEVPFARHVHSRGVLLDKAAVLHYARILAKSGRWVSCECCFTVVHDVLVACTSIYRRGEKSERRAMEAPQIRRLFSSSPRDPRYHMLEHLSPKFRMPPMEREPRAALILNRFTRTLTIMFATNAVASILGVPPEQVKDKSFYECIQENCLQDAIKCLESAKANDSIAYLRFWYRDPRREEDFAQNEADMEAEDDENMSQSTDSDSGGARVNINMGLEENPQLRRVGLGVQGATEPQGSDVSPNNTVASTPFFTSSVATSHQTSYTSQAASPGFRVDSADSRGPRLQRNRDLIPTFELEAVVSCTSDGLVVVLRKARPPIPALHPPLLPTFGFENGLFAAPWGQQPIRPTYPPEMVHTFRPPLLPQYMPLRDNVEAAGGPPLEQLMKSIRDVAVFAWALVGINGNIAAFSQGSPTGEAQPADGLPIWHPVGQHDAEERDAKQMASIHTSTEHGYASSQIVAPGMPLTSYTSSLTRFDNPPYSGTPSWPSATGQGDASYEESMMRREGYHATGNANLQSGPQQLPNSQEWAASQFQRDDLSPAPNPDEHSSDPTEGYRRPWQ